MDPPVIAPGPPPIDPMGKIDPKTDPDSAGCYLGCCGLAVALWVVPVVIFTASWLRVISGVELVWPAFWVVEALAAAGGAWTASKWVKKPAIRGKVALGGAATAVLFTLGAIGCLIWSNRVEAEPDEYLPGLLQMILAIACVPPALGGAAIFFGTFVFPEPLLVSGEKADGAEGTENAA
ncbi:hypothetical protein [Alienimonas chondri]|uniref:Uncharacterized protein n=1 Tax=Alienimonas chondri TaxID=2681879 RepID=A0ABX1VEV5_9PLAN|nr:hypothetical protein [Alienimonas chondri]NNJ26638.1 hypothetical protein [Alienimonas chondri]